MLPKDDRPLLGAVKRIVVIVIPPGSDFCKGDGVLWFGFHLYTTLRIFVPNLH